jgi:MFS family permease
LANPPTTLTPLDADIKDYMKGKYLPAGLIAVLLLVGGTIGYAHNTTPAPFMPSIISFFGLDAVLDQSVINLSMSIIFATTVPGNYLGTWLEQKIGARHLFSLAMIIMAIGVLFVFVPSNKYGIFLAGRVIYGLGFGFSIPAFGSAFMKWFRPKGRQLMVTLNGLLPLLGALVSYAWLPIVGAAYGGEAGMEAGWNFGYGFTGFILVAVLAIWLIFMRKSADNIDIAAEEERFLGTTEADTGKKENVFAWPFIRQETRFMLICFICDFMMYMYIATVLPLWLMSAGGMGEVQANFWAAIAFPLFGVVGVILGGVITNATGRRQPVIFWCQVIKLAGIVLACFTADFSAFGIIIGMALFGLGNGGWMSPFFLVPTEMKGTSASKVAASYATLMSCGYVAGLIMPVVGGLLATNLIEASTIVGENAQLAYGYKWSMLILGLFHIIAIIFAAKLNETGPGKRQKAASL